MTALSLPESVEPLETRKRRRGETHVERLYRCPNGWSLGAVRGGPLVLASQDSWEVFTLDPLGVVCGRSVGFVSDETLRLAVERLASWDFTPAAAVEVERRVASS
jgi:hypothetical protein